MEMEYYSYPALNDVYLYGDIDLSVWKRVFEAIETVVMQMQSHRYQPADPAQLPDAMRTMYEHKTKVRLQPIIDDPRFEGFCGESVMINGEECMGISQCL